MLYNKYVLKYSTERKGKKIMYEVVGIREVDYLSKSNKQVKGRNLCVVYDDNSTVGKAVDNLFCSGEIANSIVVGDKVDILYNKYGRIVMVQRY